MKFEIIKNNQQVTAKIDGSTEERFLQFLNVLPEYISSNQNYTFLQGDTLFYQFKSWLNNTPQTNSLISELINLGKFQSGRIENKNDLMELINACAFNLQVTVRMIESTELANKNKNNYNYIDQVKRLNSILQSIGTNGLTVRRPESIVSAHEPGLRAFCFNYVCLSSTMKFDALAESLSYEKSAGLWPIAMEGYRYNPNMDSLDVKAVNAALQNSACFVFNISDQVKTNSRVKKPVPDYRITSSRTDNESLFHEYRTESSIKTKDISAIFAPRHLVPFVESHFIGKTIIAIDPIKITMKHLPMMFYGARMLAQKSRDIEEVQLTGPNYSQGLQTFFQQSRLNSEFGIHLTRLPVIQRTYTDEEKASILDTLERITNYTEWKAYKENGLTILLQVDSKASADMLVEKLLQTKAMHAVSMLISATKKNVVKVEYINPEKLKVIAIDAEQITEDIKRTTLSNSYCYPN